MEPADAMTEPAPSTHALHVDRAGPTRVDGLVQWTIERPALEPSLAFDAGFPEGTLIGHKYVVGPLLGRGGTAHVFRAHGHAIGRPVALKIQTRAAADDLGSRSRFLRESRLLASIDHPSVVRVFEVGILQDGSLACALELLDGLTLRETLAQEGRLPSVRAVEIAVQLASALSAIHERGIVHRDLKPANIMLVPSRRGLRVKLIDFGAAKPAERTERNITAPADIVGTPGYLAPEQLAPGALIDARTDLFGLGVVLFEMLLGHRPFGTSGASLVRALAEGASAVLEALLEVASEPLAQLVAALCASDPAARPMDARAVLAMLTQLPEAAAASMQDPTESTEPTESTLPPSAALTQVLVVSASPVRRAAWSRVVTNLGAVAIPLAHVEAAQLLLGHGTPAAPCAVLLDRTATRDDEEVWTRGLTSLEPARLGRVIHVVRELRGFWPGPDARVRPLSMPVTEADLAALLLP